MRRIPGNRSLQERQWCCSRRQQVDRLRRVSWAIPSIECRSVNVQTMWEAATGGIHRDSLHCEVAQAVLGLFGVLARILSGFVELR